MASPMATKVNCKAKYYLDAMNLQNYTKRVTKYDLG